MITAADRARPVKRSRLQMAALWTAMLVFVGAVVFAAFEVTLRVVINRALSAAEAGSPLIQSSIPGLGYELATNQQTGTVLTDSHGFRVSSPHESTERRTVLLLGDSVAYGMGVSYEKTMAPLLESRLKSEPGLTAAVRNASVPGYNTVQEAIRLRQVGPAVHPDLVIVEVCLNDYLDAPRLTDGGVLDASAAHAGSDFSLLSLAYGSRTLVFFKDKIRDAEQMYPEWFPMWAHYIHYVHQKPGWEQAKSALREIADTTRRIDARLLIVIFPMEQQLRIGDRAAQDALLSFAQAHDIATLDLYESFRSNWRTGLYVDYWENAGVVDKLHLSERGHALAASEMARAIAIRDFYPATGVP